MDEDKDVQFESHELLINARKPEGELGAKLLDRMNKSHADLTKWGVSHLDISKDDIILDIGCGGGVNVKMFLELSDEKIFGLDYSDVAVEKSIKLNQDAINSNRCEIIQGSVSNLPFEDNSFDIVTCFETVYFWPDFVNDLKEVRRTLKDGGIIFICNESLPKENDATQKELIDLLGMAIYSDDELDEYLRQAGFSEVISFVKEDLGWVCIIAIK